MIVNERHYAEKSSAEKLCAETSCCRHTLCSSVSEFTHVHCALFNYSFYLGTKPNSHTLSLSVS